MKLAVLRGLLNLGLSLVVLKQVLLREPGQPLQVLSQKGKLGFNTLPVCFVPCTLAFSSPAGGESRGYGSPMNGSRSGLDADSNAESIAGVTTYATFSPATGAYLTGTGRNATDSRSRSKSPTG